MNAHVTRCVHLITFGFDICNQGIDIWFRDTVNRPALVRMGFSWGHVFDLWIHILSHSTHELCTWHLRSRRPISRHGRAPRPGSLRAAQRAEKPLLLRIELSLLSDHRPVQAHMCNTNINTNTAFLIIGSSPRCIYMFYTYTLCSWGSSEHVLLWSRARFVWYKLWTKVLYVVNGFDTKMKHM